MRYEVRRKQEEHSSSDHQFTLMLKSPSDIRFLEVGEDDYRRVNVGDVIEMLISVVPKEVVDGK